MRFGQVTFAVLVFPSEHHQIAFVVASIATGSCVLKLGLGRLLGESGEIFKILDDPLGDRCHASRCDSPAVPLSPPQPTVEAVERISAYGTFSIESAYQTYQKDKKKTNLHI